MHIRQCNTTTLDVVSLIRLKERCPLSGGYISKGKWFPWRWLAGVLGAMTLAGDSLRRGVWLGRHIC